MRYTLSKTTLKQTQNDARLQRARGWVFKGGGKKKFFDFLLC